MARGDFTVFDEFVLALGKEAHELSSDTLKLGLVDDTITPAADDATPTWGDYSTNEVATAGNYTADGETLSGVTYTEADGTATLDDTGNIALAQDASNGFTDAYWGILYNASSTGNQAIGFLELDGPISEQTGPVNINWRANGILTVATS